MKTNLLFPSLSSYVDNSQESTEDGFLTQMAINASEKYINVSQYSYKRTHP